MALKALKAVKENIVESCSKNEELLKHLSKIAIKAATRVGIELVVKGAVRIVANELTKPVASQGVKGIAMAAVHPAGVAADVAQALLEYKGYEEEEKKVGIGGNVLSGILFGGTVGGLPGAAVGALGGFMMWLVGEVTGGLVERAFGTQLQDHND